eukprot:6198769-Pleurochrysis_carterae.AAC.5
MHRFPRIDRLDVVQVVALGCERAKPAPRVRPANVSATDDRREIGPIPLRLQPLLDDGCAWQSRWRRRRVMCAVAVPVHGLLPSHRLLAILCQDGGHARHVRASEPFEREFSWRHATIGEVGAHRARPVPAAQVHLVRADVHLLVREELGELTEHIVQERVCGSARRVERVAFAQRGVGVAEAPRGGVRGRVNLRDDADPPLGRVLNEKLHVARGVGARRAVGAKGETRRALEP